MATLIAVDADRLDALERRLDELTDSLRGATVTPRPEWIGVPDAARIMGVTPATIRRKIAAGEIEARGTGKTRQVRI